MSGIFSKDIAVLDVNSKTICAIIGSKKTQSVFSIKSIVEKEYQGFENGEWFDSHDTIQIAKTVLSECISNANSRVKKIYISVPAEFLTIVTRDVNITLDRKRLVNEQDIKYLYKKGVDFNSNNYCLINTKPIYFAIDDQDSLVDDIVGMEASYIESCVSYVLAEKTFVQMFDELADDMGFSDIVFVGTPLSESLTLLDKENRDDIYSLIDVGYLSSSLTIAKGEGILDMRSFSLGGAHIAADIYETLDVPFENAQLAQQLVDLNLNYPQDAILVGNMNKNILATDVVEITKARIDEIVEIIGDVYKEFEEYLPSNMKIYLTGEGVAPIRGAKKYLSEQLGKNIEIVTPKLPGFVKSEDSSKIALLLMADKMTKVGFIDRIKKMFIGGKRK